MGVCFKLFQVYNASLSLTEWQEMVASLRSEYEKLVYFSIPKLLHLYQNLIMEHPSVGNIVADVGILFQNKHDVKKKLRRTIRVSAVILEGKLSWEGGSTVSRSLDTPSCGCGREGGSTVSRSLDTPSCGCGREGARYQEA